MANRLQQLLDLVYHTTYDDLPADAVARCQVFILDSLGVGISGSRVTSVPILMKLATENWGQGSAATIWNGGIKTTTANAAMVNAFQIHNQEFDCVHEPAVVHPMAVILSTVLAAAETLENRGQPVSGSTLIETITLAVEVAARLGTSASKPMRFFRPAMCGSLGATVAIAKLYGLSKAQAHNAMGIVYCQLSGTLQAHVEGSEMLPMQIAFNARNTIVAVEMAADGFTGPQDVIHGQFGFFNLFEDDGNADSAFASLGTEWQITQVSHKPFPTGRAGHGGIDALMQLREKHGFNADDIERIELLAPPLIHRLVGRPAKAGMTTNYAKLCMGYIAATLLETGDVGVAEFDADVITSPSRLEFAQKVVHLPNECEDPNALVPQSLRVILKSGEVVEHHMPAVLGSPIRPLTEEQHLTKFRKCCASARRPLPDANTEALIELVDALPKADSISPLIARTHSF